MDLQEHIALSLPAAGLIYLAAGDAGAALSFAAVAVLIDLDHLVDYWRETGFNRQVRVFLRYFDQRRPIHSYLPLHGWEWPLQCLAVAVAAGAPAWVWSGMAGWMAHLILDHRYNRLTPFAYFFLYRWSVRFEAGAIYGSGDQSQA